MPSGAVEAPGQRSGDRVGVELAAAANSAGPSRVALAEDGGGVGPAVQDVLDRGLEERRASPRRR